MSDSYRDIPEELRQQYEQCKDFDIISLNEIEESSVKWLFSGRIPEGEITIFAGDGGVGKTSVICQIVAAISNGSTNCILDEGIPREFTRKPGKVLFFSSEDDFSKVLKRRIAVYGADMKNIFTIETSSGHFKELKFNSPLLNAILNVYRPVLCVFDPLQSFIPENVNMCARNEMRSCLNALVGYARKYGTTFIIAMHSNKRTSAYGRNRVADSADIWDICRSLFLFGMADNETKIRYISMEKSNYGIPANTILFSIDSEGKAVYQGTTTKKDVDFITSGSDSKSIQEDVKQMIIDRLAEEDEQELRTKELDEYLIACGASKATAGRAKTELKKQNVIRFRSEGTGSDKVWFTKLVSVLSAD